MSPECLIPPSAISGTSASRQTSATSKNGRQLRHPHACDHARGADGAGTDPNLDAIGAGVDQRFRAFRRRHVTAHDLGVVAERLDALDRRDDAAAVPVGRIDHHHIHLGLEQNVRARVPRIADTGRGGNAQAAVFVLGGVRKCFCLFDVLDGHQSGAAKVGVHHQKFLDAMGVQQALRLLAIDAFGDGHQRLVRGVPRHQLADRLAGIVREPDVAVGQYPHQPAVAVLDHRNARDAVGFHKVKGVGQRRVGADNERIDHHPRFELLDRANLGGLFVRFHVLVDDSDSAGLRHGDGESRPRDRVHGRRKNRNAQLDRAGEARIRGGLGGKNL